ncbi:MAG: GntR family transcriptional regulator [Victivallaceae bacterium]|jgi:DNA-binding LacI/PurR family transcriptional regulator
MADTAQVEMRLSEQVSDRIIADIKSGGIDSSKRLPGYRVLAGKYNVSWGTVIEALHQLEKNSVIQRRSRSGTYISPRYLDNFKKTAQLAFVFPEKSLSREILNYEIWGINSEVYHGMIDEAAQNNARIEFKYMEDTADEIILDQQMCQLQDIDGVVMLGHQLGHLRQRILAAGKRLAIVNSYFETLDDSASCVALSLVQSMRKIGRFIYDSGYRSVTLINGSLNRLDWAMKEELLLEYLKSKQIVVTEKYNVDADNIEPAVKKILKESTGELYCCFQTDTLPVLFRESLDSGRMPGRDFDLIGLASGLTFANYYPSISYFKVPYFELGKAACRLATGQANTKEFELEFIKGQTTNVKQHQTKEMYV